MALRHLDTDDGKTVIAKDIRFAIALSQKKLPSLSILSETDRLCRNLLCCQALGVLQWAASLGQTARAFFNCEFKNYCSPSQSTFFFVFFFSSIIL